MPSSLVFLGLIYPDRRHWAPCHQSSAFASLMSGFALVGPFAAIGLYEISRRRELGLDTSWAHAFGVARSHSIFSILSLGLLLLVIFAGWEFTAKSLYVALFGSTLPGLFHTVRRQYPRHATRLAIDRIRHRDWFRLCRGGPEHQRRLIPVASRPRCRRPGRHSDFRQGRIDEPFHHGAVGIDRRDDPGDWLLRLLFYRALGSVLILIDFETHLIERSRQPDALVLISRGVESILTSILFGSVEPSQRQAAQPRRLLTHLNASSQIGKSALPSVCKGRASGWS